MNQTFSTLVYNPVNGEYNDSLSGDYLWSSVNTREANPDVMTPFSWSLQRYGFAKMIMLPGYLSVGNICGRIYNNASVGATAFQALGQSNSFEASSKELYGVDPGDIAEWNLPLIPIGLRDRLLVLRNIVRLNANIRKAVKSAQTFLDTNPSWCERQHRTLPNLDKNGLLRWANEVSLPYSTHCFWWLVGSTMALANLISKLRRDLLDIAGPEDTNALLSSVSSEDE
ncbi:hypothetical protein ACFLZW_06790, partial [Chloroflexota bacterium]